MFFEGFGDSQNPHNLYVTGVPSVGSIQPGSGSIYGGTLLAIQGNGFDKTTKVTLGSAVCSIQSLAINTLTCITGPNTAGGPVQLQIK